MKLENLRWDVVGDGVWVDWGCEGKGKGRSKKVKHAFRRSARYAFGISMTFARGLHSLIV